MSKKTFLIIAGILLTGIAVAIFLLLKKQGLFEKEDNAISDEDKSTTGGGNTSGGTKTYAPGETVYAAVDNLNIRSEPSDVNGNNIVMVASKGDNLGLYNGTVSALLTSKSKGKWVKMSTMNPLLGDVEYIYAYASLVN